MDLWTGDRVKAELVAAFEVLFDTSGPVGPGGHGSNWPSYVYEAREIWEMRREGTNTVGRMRARIQRRAKEVTASDNVLYGMRLKNGIEIKGWIPQFLEKQGGARRCLLAHVFGTVEANRFDRKFKVSVWCRRHGVSESTFRSRRDRGAEMVAFGLNEFGVPVW